MSTCTPYNEDTSIFEFGLEEGQVLGLPVCGCLLMIAPGKEHGGGDAVRPYTPISPAWMKGKFQVIIKRNQSWGDPAWPHSFKPAGAVSTHLHGKAPQPTTDWSLTTRVNNHNNIVYRYRSSTTQCHCIGHTSAP